MKIKHLITAITMIACLLFAAERSMAHGERHAGGHADAVANDCLKPIQMKGLVGMGYWENSCSYGVHVRWFTESDEPTGCESHHGILYPCLAYVGANTRGSAIVSDNSGHGSVSWIACRAENFYSDPWPRITKVNPDKSVKFNCFHMGFGPGGQQVVSKSELEKALRTTHGQITYSLHQYKKQELARIEREQEREQVRARRQWEEQEREWEEEQFEKKLQAQQQGAFRQQMNQLSETIQKRSWELYRESLREKSNRPSRTYSPSVYCPPDATTTCIP